MSFRSGLTAQASTGRSVETMTADLDDKQDLARVEALLREDAGLTLLVDNAGFGGVTPLLDSDVDKMEQAIDVNVTAVMRLTYAVAPKFLERGKGAGREIRRRMIGRRRPAFERVPASGFERQPGGDP